MCGIAGFLDPDATLPPERLAARAEAMAATIAHRGPDEADTFVDAAAGLAFGHRRLSIIDLSPTGHQPMTSADGRHVITYNGEVYNFLELRKRLESEGRTFRGTSDTEVLVEGIARWGLQRTLEVANGMFAFAVWDRRERVLQLARDRVGEKPLYYGHVGRVFVFGSELKALRAFPGCDPPVDRSALAAFLRYSYVPSPRSIYEGISKLPPGTSVAVRADGTVSDPVPYWSFAEVAERGWRDRLDVTGAEAVDLIEAALRRSVGLRMLADVPVGAFLSGGVDSSTIVALMQAQSPGAVRTFTIGFPEAGFDEAAHAAAVARHLGTDHTELTVSPDDVLQLVPRLPATYDEPFADSSQLPTMLVSSLTSSIVTVGLSGDAGDELFGGYVRHAVLERILERGGRLPRPLRVAAAVGLAAVRPATWNRLAAAASKVVGRRVPAHAGEKAHKLARVLRASGPSGAYDALATTWTGEGSVPMARGVAVPTTASLDGLPARLSLTERVMLADSLTYLPDDILVKVDRASMAASLETRVPMLDHELIGLAWRLPIDLRVRGGETKWLLREILARHVPPAITERPKMGFAVPIARWLRGPLREWAGDHLSEVSIRGDGFLDPAPITRMWREHLKGSRDHAPGLWSVLMFRTWHEARRSMAGTGHQPG